MSQTSMRDDTSRRIVEQAARLLQEQGPAAVTTRGVAHAAGVQAPTIYRLFGDKDGLLDAVAEHVLATYVESKAAAAEAAIDSDADPLEDLRAGWRAQMEFSVSNPSLFALLNDPARAGSSPAATRGKEVLATKMHRLAASGQLRVSEERAIDLVHAAGTGVALAILSRPPAERDLALAEEMLESVLGQILVDAPKRDAEDWRSAVVAARAVVPRLEMLTAAERRLLAEWLDRAIGS